MNEVKANFSQSFVLPFFLTIAFVFLYGIQDLAGFARFGGAYTPFAASEAVSAQTYDETQLYAPGARRFAETGSLTTEADIYELRNEPSAYPVLHSIALGLMARALGSFDLTWALAHAVFPALIWLVLYLCARGGGLSPVSAAVLGACVCLVSFGPRNFFLMGEHALIQPLELARTPQPSLSFLLLIISIWTTSRAFVTKTIFSSVVAGVALSLNFYSYYYYWIGMGLGLSVWFISALVLRRYADLRVLIVAGLTCVIFALPYLLTVIEVRHSESNLALMARVGVFTHAVNYSGLLIAISFGCCAVAAYVRNQHHPLVYVYAFAATGAALGLNFQVLTGYNAQHEGHFTNRLLQPLAFFLAGMIVLPFIQRSRSWRPVGIVVLIGLLVLATYRQVRVSENVIAHQDRTSSPIGVVDGLKGMGLPSDSVIGCADPEIFMVVPAESTFWNFVPYGDRTLASNEEIFLRYLTLRKIEGATEADVRKEFAGGYPSKKRDRDLNYHFFLYRWTADALMQKIEQQWPLIDLDTELRDRKLDFVVSQQMSLQQAPTQRVRFVKIGTVGKWNVFKRE